MKRHLLIATACVILPTGVAHAQVEGTIVSEAGAPVPNAQVEIWSPTDRLAVHLANPNGGFAFRAEESRNGVAIIVRRIGFAPLRAPLAAGTHDLMLRMHPLAASLPEVTVTAAARLCPNAESVAARALWKRARRSYDNGDGLARGAELVSARGDVAADHVGDISRLRWTRGSRQSSAAGVAGYRAGITDLGYVWPAPRRHFKRDYGIWFYPPLSTNYAEHFADSLFGARHIFSIASASSAETVLAFCPRDRKHSGLQGTLRIAADDSFIAARWRFWNPARDAEDAGGEVVFAPRDTSRRYMVLLPASGLFWRRLRSGLYYEHWERYARWSVWPDDRAAEAP